MVSGSDCQPVPPKKKNDRVVALLGESKGLMGLVVGTDGQDFLVRFDGQSDIALLENNCLGKLAASA